MVKLAIGRPREIVARCWEQTASFTCTVSLLYLFYCESRARVSEMNAT